MYDTYFTAILLCILQEDVLLLKDTYCAEQLVL